MKFSHENLENYKIFSLELGKKNYCTLCVPSLYNFLLIFNWMMAFTNPLFYYLKSLYIFVENTKISTKKLLFHDWKMCGFSF
jgi:hypothetical protein